MIPNDVADVLLQIKSGPPTGVHADSVSSLDSPPVLVHKNTTGWRSSYFNSSSPFLVSWPNNFRGRRIWHLATCVSCLVNLRGKRESRSVGKRTRTWWWEGTSGWKIPSPIATRRKYLSLFPRLLCNGSIRASFQLVPFLSLSFPSFFPLIVFPLLVLSRSRPFFPWCWHRPPGQWGQHVL